MTEGNVVPWADSINVAIQITGAGKLAGVANGNPKDMASFQQPVRKTYMGACLLIARPGREKGAITVTARAEGLKDGVTSVLVK